MSRVQLCRVGGRANSNHQKTSREIAHIFITSTKFGEIFGNKLTVRVLDSEKQMFTHISIRQTRVIKKNTEGTNMNHQGTPVSQTQ